MTLPQGADYSLTESALSPFPAEPAQRGKQGHQKRNSEAPDCGSDEYRHQVSQDNRRHLERWFMCINQRNHRNDCEASNVAAKLWKEAFGHAFILAQASAAS